MDKSRVDYGDSELRVMEILSNLVLCSSFFLPSKDVSAYSPILFIDLKLQKVLFLWLLFEVTIRVVVYIAVNFY